MSSVHSKPVHILMDCQHVKRWTLVGTVSESNVASHSFNVAMVAMAIRQAMGYKTHFTEEEVCYQALMHDVDEAETGDIPTPTKAAFRKSGVEPNGLFDTQGRVPLAQEIVTKIVKMADLIENYYFISQHGTGARAGEAATEVSGRLREALRTASDDLRQAATSVLWQIENRRTNDNRERKEVTEALKGRSGAVPCALSLIVDREPCDCSRSA